MSCLPLGMKCSIFVCQSAKHEVTCFHGFLKNPQFVGGKFFPKSSLPSTILECCLFILKKLK